MRKASAGYVPEILGNPDDWRSTMLYGIAHFGKSLFWYASEILFAYFLTEITGLDGIQMGIVLAIGLAFSAGLDPIVGQILTRTLSDTKRAILLQLLGSVSSSCALIVLFLGAWIPPSYCLPYAIAAGMVFRFAYALYDLPQNALISLATRDVAARTRVTSTRLVFSGLAALVIAGAVSPLTLAHNSVEGAGPMLIALAVGLSLGAISTAGLLVYIVGRPIAVTDLRSRATPWRHALPKACRLPLFLALVMSVSIPLFGKLQPYLTGYGLSSTWWGGIIGCAVPVGSLGSQPVWSALSSHCSRNRLIRLSSSVTALGGLTFWFSVSAQPFIAALGAVAVGAGSGGLAMSIWASFGDAIANAKGREGWGFGLLTASFKLGLAIGGLALGMFLGHVDYRANDSATLSTAMTVAVISGALACLVMTMLAGKSDDPPLLTN